jgi:hypothetical protein
MTVPALPPQEKPHRTALWLYSRANVWGCIAGLAGVALFIGGVIGPGWLAIVAGLYGIGALAAPRQRAPDFAMPGGFSAADVEKLLGNVAAALKGSVGAGTMQRMDSIREQAAALLPRLDDPALLSDDRDLLRETLTRYLPDSVSAYLRLPALYRRLHVVRDGKTAESILAEQLALIDGKLRELMDRAFRADAQAMLVQGRFLDNKFNRPDLLGAADGEDSKSGTRR